MPETLPDNKHNPLFFRLLAANTVSTCGSSMIPLALTWAMLERGYGVFGVSVVLGTQSAAGLLFLLVGGVAGDRFRPRNVMLTACLLLSLTQAVSGSLFLHGGHPHLVVVALLSATAGALRSFLSPSATSMLLLLGRPGIRHRMNTLWGMTTAGGEMAGPAIAGILIAYTGPGPAILIDSVTYIMSALLISSLPSGEISKRSENMMRMLSEGWKEFIARDWIWIFVAQFGLLALLCFPAFYVNGPLLIGTDGEGAGRWGFLLAGEGLGAVVGGIAAYRMHPRRPMVLSVLFVLPMGLPTLFLAIHAPFAVIFAGMVGCGVGIAVCNALWNTTVQREVPREALARVKAFDILGSNSMTPAGYAIAGPVAALMGSEGALWLGTIVLFVSTLGVLCLKSIRTLQWD